MKTVAVPVGPAATGATALRVLTQLRRDPRTVALLLLVPAVLMTLLRYVFDGQPQTFDRLGAPLIGLFPFITMFLVTSITMLRERTGGTLERLMSMPLAKLDLLSGYGLAFAAVAAVQAGITAGVAFLALGLDVEGSAVVVVALAVGNAVLGMSLGLFVSAFASSEFQAVQFMPAFVLPQLILCGLFVPREEMAGALDAASYVLPLTYAFDALERAASGAGFGVRGWADVAVIVGVTLLALALGALTLRRRTP
jgi:ABC-2 type transport system permease protein